MRLFVTTYHKYNEGTAAGQWLELHDYNSHAEFMRACIDLHSDEHDPEIMISDWEDVPHIFINDPRLFDYIKLNAEEQAQLIDYGETMGWSHIRGMTVHSIMTEIQEQLVCEMDDWREYAESQFEDQHEIPDRLKPYIDWALIRRDFRQSYTFGKRWVWGH